MTLSIGGLASGLDTNGIIDQMLAIQQQPIARLQQQESVYEVELTTYGSLQGFLNSLQTSLQAENPGGSRQIEAGKIFQTNMQVYKLHPAIDHPVVFYFWRSVSELLC